jgi:hypothetical protein
LLWISGVGSTIESGASVASGEAAHCGGTKAGSRGVGVGVGVAVSVGVDVGTGVAVGGTILCVT